MIRLFQVRDPRRAFTLIIFASLAAAAAASRVLVRLAMEGLWPVLGAGPSSQAFDAKLEGYREIGPRVIGFRDDSSTCDSLWLDAKPLARTIPPVLEGQ